MSRASETSGGSNLKVRMLQFVRSQDLQRILLELNLETTPRDSRYSNTLVDLMKKEDFAIREDANSQLTRELIQRVDQQLHLETSRFFSKVVGQNIKRWNSLSQKVERELDRFVQDESPSLKRKLSTPIQYQYPQSRETATLADLEAEELRLEEDYNLNWLQHEGFNLREAFRSQATRVETDWGNHETNLTEDYNSRRSALLGVHYASSGTTGGGGEESRWQHPEKQKTLIHTAPVLAPSVSVGGGGGGGGVVTTKGKNKGKEDSIVELELQRLHRQYQESLLSLQSQKVAAQRWMGRQRVRLEAQATETAVERRAIASLISLVRHYSLHIQQIQASSSLSPSPAPSPAPSASASPSQSRPSPHSTSSTSSSPSTLPPPSLAPNDKGLSPVSSLRRPPPSPSHHSPTPSSSSSSSSSHGISMSTSMKERTSMDGERERDSSFRSIRSAGGTRIDRG